VRLSGGDVGLFCGDVELFWWRCRALCGDVGLFCGDVGHFGGGMGLFCGFLSANKGSFVER